jgi:hypothetical protein
MPIMFNTILTEAGLSLASPAPQRQTGHKRAQPVRIMDRHGMAGKTQARLWALNRGVSDKRLTTPCSE